MQSISIRERHYYFRDEGAGPALLLLHGFPFSHESFAPQLSAPPGKLRVIAPDHRGFGQSELGDTSGVTTMEDMADDALAIMDELGLEQAFIGGVSMGGYVAMALAAKAPRRVRGLLLIDTQAGADDDAGKARRETVATEVLEKGAAVVADAMRSKLFAPITDDAIKRTVYNMMLAQAPAAIAAASRGMALRPDRTEMLASLLVPALIVVGEEDGITPVAKAQAMKDAMPNSQLVVIPSAGHLPNLEQPEAFANAVAKFVQSA